jgi:CBS domain-containing protein
VVDAPELREARICRRLVESAKGHRIDHPAVAPSSVPAWWSGIGGGSDAICGFSAMCAAPAPMHAAARGRTIEGGTCPKESAMRVADVMTTEVFTVTPETSLKEVAELLTALGISGAPVVDEEQHVVGVVSEADILAKERRRPSPDALHRIMHRPVPPSAKQTARTAGEAMTAPAVTVTGSRRLDVAAALMLDRQVNRLPVVDEHGTLVGIVTRADLVRAFVHTDEEILREIREEVLLRELWLRPEDFDLRVERGEVTVSGHLPNEDERELLIRRITLVPGVVSVEVEETTQV